MAETTVAQVLLLSLPGGGEWLLIFLAILLLFGGKKIPELMRGIGKGIREFQRAKNAVEDEIKRGMEEADREAEQKLSPRETPPGNEPRLSS